MEVPFIDLMGLWEAVEVQEYVARVCAVGRIFVMIGDSSKEVVDIPLDAGRDLSRWRMVRVFSFLVGFLSF